MNLSKKMGLHKKLFYALEPVMFILGALILLGMFATSIADNPKQAAQLLQDYLAYILGFAAIMYGNAAGGIIANHYSNKEENSNVRDTKSN